MNDANTKARRLIAALRRRRAAEQMLIGHEMTDKEAADAAEEYAAAVSVVDEILEEGK